MNKSIINHQSFVQLFSFTYSFIGFFIRWLVQGTFTYSLLICLCTYSIIYLLLMYQFVRSCAHFFLHSYIHTFKYGSYVHMFICFTSISSYIFIIHIYSSTHWSVYPSIHISVYPSNYHLLFTTYYYSPFTIVQFSSCAIIPPIHLCSQKRSWKEFWVWAR